MITPISAAHLTDTVTMRRPDQGSCKRQQKEELHHLLGPELSRLRVPELGADSSSEDVRCSFMLPCCDRDDTEAVPVVPASDAV